MVEKCDFCSCERLVQYLWQTPLLLWDNDNHGRQSLLVYYSIIMYKRVNLVVLYLNIILIFNKGAFKNHVILFWPPIHSPLWSKMIFWWPPSPPKDHAIFERVFCVNIQIYSNQFDYRLTITDQQKSWNFEGVILSYYCYMQPYYYGIPV